MGAQVRLDVDRIDGIARRVEGLLDGQPLAWVRSGADAGTHGTPGAQVPDALDEACGELVRRLDALGDALASWAAAVRVGGEVFVAADQRARATTGVQVPR